MAYQHSGAPGAGLCFALQAGKPRFITSHSLKSSPVFSAFSSLFKPSHPARAGLLGSDQCGFTASLSLTLCGTVTKCLTLQGSVPPLWTQWVIQEYRVLLCQPCMARELACDLLFPLELRNLPLPPRLILLGISPSWPALADLFICAGDNKARKIFRLWQEGSLLWSLQSIGSCPSVPLPILFPAG